MSRLFGLTADSRRCEPGWLFAALPGAKADGAQFVADAIAKGAAAVLLKAGCHHRRCPPALPS